MFGATGHLPELIIILVLGLVILGPGKLPQVGGAVGKTIREFRKASTETGEEEAAKDGAAPVATTTVATTVPTSTVATTVPTSTVAAPANPSASAPAPTTTATTAAPVPPAPKMEQ